MALNTYIAERKAIRKPLVMTHVVCGYPSFDANMKELEVMAAHGVDFVELQFPFSEPSADGPLFVKANQESVASGTTVAQCFEFMAEVTKRFDFKVLMMGYYNTCFKMGHENFINRLKAAGGCGYILPDLPIEEAAELHALSKAADLTPVILMTPTNTDERLAQLGAASEGLVYCVARKGVTGTKTDMSQDLVTFLDRCRKFTDVAIGVGFGVSEKADIDFIGEHGDIAIIGTAALKAWELGEEVALNAFFDSLGL